MKKILLITLLVSTVSFAQKAKNGWQSANLKCKVKTAGQVEYVPNEKGELIQEGQDFYANFNKKGYITDMQMKQGKEVTKLVIAFDKNGFPSKTESYNEKGKMTYHSIQENDAKGRTLLEKGFTDDGLEVIKTIFIYDKKGFLIEKQMHQFGNYALKSVYTNDKKGNPLEEKNYDAQNALNYRITSKYDKKGNRTEAIAYDKKGKIMEHYTYQYDKHNNQIQEESYNSEGGLNYKKTFSYQYDKRGNWNKKHEYTDGKLSKVTEQFVEYY
ncbi:MAG: hypothetical protein Q4A09_05595 [Capnocytophaga felis]|nr:hypothetical protein [Capnocytophaga felis]